MGTDESLRDRLGVRKRVSVVWKYFEKLSSVRVRCKLCFHEQNYQGTTGNILRHLKSKHNIDVSQKTQCVKQEDLAALHASKHTESQNEDSQIEFEVVVESDQARQHRTRPTKVVSYCEEPDVDPYTEVIELGDYMQTDPARAKKSDKKYPLSMDAADIDKGMNRNSGAGANVPNARSGSASSVQEERILAEIEYFREKAAYYRMQKNLTALQAMKVKYELDRMVEG